MMSVGYDYLSGYTKDMKKQFHSICEECNFYVFYDSGYGYCTINPPTIQVRKTGFFSKEKFIEYPLVEWDRYSCGRFIEKVLDSKKK